MSRGTKLTVAEKYALDAMYKEGLPVRKMALHLGRTEGYIKKHIDEMKKADEVFSLANQYPESVKPEETEETKETPENTEEYVENPEDQIGPLVKKSNKFLSEETEELLFKRLAGSTNWQDHEIMACIKRTKAKLKQYIPIDRINDLVAFALRDVNIKSTMITQTAGRKKGVAIMTEAAGMRSDDAKKKGPKKVDKPHIFQPHSGTVKGE